MRGRALFGVVGALFASDAVRAQVRVSSCAALEASRVEVEGTLELVVVLDREPAVAESARLELTAYDPDRNGEVAIAINGVAQPETNGLEWGAFNDRRASYSAPLDRDQLALGANTITLTDLNITSPFALERLCVTLIGAPPPASRPAQERFCARSIEAPSAWQTDVGAFVETGGTIALGFEVDVPLSSEARVGLDLVAFERVSGNAGEQHGVTARVGDVVLAGDFQDLGGPDHYLVQTEPEPVGAVSLAAVELSAPWSGRLWGACLIVADPGAPPPLDAGPPPDDAGAQDGGLPDAGIYADAGPAPVDAGPAPVDAGLPPEDAGRRDDAGLPPRDAGPGTPVDGGNPRDAGIGSGPAGDAGGPGADDPRAVLVAALSSDDFSVSSGCASAPGASWWAALLVFGVWSRRGRRSRRRVSSPSS